MNRSQTIAALELVFATTLWGFGFIATAWSLRGMGPFAITGWRFLVASAIGFALTSLSRNSRRHFTWTHFRLAAIPGLLLMLTLVLQTAAMRTTTAVKCSFITTLYVLFVPLLERFWLGRRLARLHYVYVFVALIGMALICDLASAFAPVPLSLGGPSAEAYALNWGDFLTLLCAVVAGVHMVLVGKIHARISDPIVFNNFQSLWAAPLPLVLSFALEPVPSLHVADSSLAGFLMLAIGSTLIGFALQVRAQKVIPPSLTSLLCLLESPFATLFAIYFLEEAIRTQQWFGAGLILLAAVLSTMFADEASQVAEFEIEA